MAESKDKVEVRTPLNPVVVNTAEDAAMAYLRGQMTEEEFRDACGAYGVQPGELLLAPQRLERPDDAFENKLPDDIYKPTSEHNPDLKERLDSANDKQKERDEATKRADEEARKEVQKVEVVPAGASTSPSAAAQDKPNQAQKQESKPTASTTKDK